MDFRNEIQEKRNSIEEFLGVSITGEKLVLGYLGIFLVFNLVNISLLAPSGWATYQVSNSNPPAGAFWIEGCSIHWSDGSYEYYFDCAEETSVTDSSPGGSPGAVWIEGNTIHWIDENGDARKYTQYQDSGNDPSASLGSAWIESGYLRFIDSSGNEIHTNELPGKDQ